MGVLLFVCVAALWLGFPNDLAHIPGAALLYPLGLCMLALRSEGPRNAFRWCFIAGALASTAALYWIYIPLHIYGSLPLYLALPCPALLGAYLGLYTGTFGLGYAWAADRFGWTMSGVFAALLWTLMEWLRGVLFTGFPWLMLASSHSQWPITVQAAAVVGAYALSGLMVLPGAWLAAGGFSTRSIILAFTLCAALLFFGVFRLQNLERPFETVSARLVQGNIDQSIKWEPAFQNHTLETYLQLSAEEPAADLTVWPETALPFYLQEPDRLSSKVRSANREGDGLLLVGSPAYGGGKDGEVEYYNAAFLLHNGMNQGMYYKQHLVPFGEYIPLQSFFPFLKKLVTGVGDYAPGAQDAPLGVFPMRLGVLICYEAIFPELAQARVERGATLLVNISNDAWFGNSPAPRQHLDLALLRAVEQGRWLLRATNTGITMAADQAGRIVSRIPANAAGTLFLTEVGLCRAETIFHRLFGWIIPLVAACLLLCLGVGWKTKSRMNSRKPHADSELS